MNIAVALSGGMDSLMALALVKERGWRPIALHAFFLEPQKRHRQLAQALERLCGSLDVPFATADLSAAFRHMVIDPFIQGYAAGVTPNPCAHCNRDLKFGLLRKHAATLGAPFLATGHYARTAPPGTQSTWPLPGASAPASRTPPHPPVCNGLWQAADPTKDQSYFLSLVPPASLAQAVFPLGDWKKADVPRALQARNLAPPLPAESQEICFIPGDDYRAFLLSQKAALPGPGPIVLEDGLRIGEHQGLWRHTPGQRKGIGVAWKEPLYVLEKRARENTLVVGPKSSLATYSCCVRGVNQLVAPEHWPSPVLARLCYRQRPRLAAVSLDSFAPEKTRETSSLCCTQPADAGTVSSFTLRFAEPVPRPAPGQVAALYDTTGRILAAGIIAGGS